MRSKLPFLFLLAVLPLAAFASDRDRSGFIFGGGIGGAFSSFNETDSFGPYTYSGYGGDLGWNMEVLIGGSTRQASFFATYSRTAFTSPKPLEDENGNPTGFGGTPEGIHLLGVGTNIYLANSARDICPYLSLRAGEMFQFVGTTGNNIYQGRSLGFAGGVGLQFAPHFSVEARVLAGSPRETERSLDFVSFQVMLLAISY